MQIIKLFIIRCLEITIAQNSWIDVLGKCDDIYMSNQCAKIPQIEAFCTSNSCICYQSLNSLFLDLKTTLGV